MAERVLTKADEQKAVFHAGVIFGTKDPMLRFKLIEELDVDALEHLLDSPDRDPDFRYEKVCRQLIARRRRDLRGQT